MELNNLTPAAGSVFAQGTHLGRTDMGLPSRQLRRIREHGALRRAVAAWCKEDGTRCTCQGFAHRHSLCHRSSGTPRYRPLHERRFAPLTRRYLSEVLCKLPNALLYSIFDSNRFMWHRCDTGILSAKRGRACSLEEIEL